MPSRLGQPEGERVGAPFLVKGASGRALIATPLSLDTPLLSTATTRLVLLSDPAFQMTRDCRPALQLLGLTAAEAKVRLLPLLPKDLFPGGEKAGWWQKAAQLDLEAKGIIKREETRPLRFFRPF